MRMLSNKLLPHAGQGLFLHVKDDTVYATGFREDADLEALKREVADSWLEMARQEALLLVQEGKKERCAQLKPADLGDLIAKLQLGRINPEENQRLNEYYDALDAIEGEAEALTTAANNASVADLNAMNWPEWVKWNPIPENPTFRLEVEHGAL